MVTYFEMAKGVRLLASEFEGGNSDGSRTNKAWINNDGNLMLDLEDMNGPWKCTPTEQPNFWLCEAGEEIEVIKWND